MSQCNWIGKSKANCTDCYSQPLWDHGRDHYIWTSFALMEITVIWSKVHFGHKLYVSLRDNVSLTPSKLGYNPISLS